MVAWWDSSETPRAVPKPDWETPKGPHDRIEAGNPFAQFVSNPPPVSAQDLQVFMPELLGWERSLGLELSVWKVFEEPIERGPAGQPLHCWHVQTELRNLSDAPLLLRRHRFAAGVHQWYENFDWKEDGDETGIVRVRPAGGETEGICRWEGGWLDGYHGTFRAESFYALPVPNPLWDEFERFPPLYHSDIFSHALSGFALDPATIKEPRVGEASMLDSPTVTLSENNLVRDSSEELLPPQTSWRTRERIVFSANDPLWISAGYFDLSDQHPGWRPRMGKWEVSPAQVGGGKFTRSSDLFNRWIGGLVAIYHRKPDKPRLDNETGSTPE